MKMISIIQIPTQGLAQKGNTVSEKNTYLQEVCFQLRCLDVEVLLCVRIDIRMWKYTLARKWYLKNIPSKVSLNSHSFQNFSS